MVSIPEHTELEIDSVISRQNIAKEGWTTYYVDGTNGNDASNGLRWETAKKTIQAAIDTAESWANIYVKAGTYVENITISKHGISLIGERRDGVIINPSSGVAITSSGFGNSFSGFTLFSKIAQGYSLIITGDFTVCSKLKCTTSIDLGRGIDLAANFCDIHALYVNSALMQNAIRCDGTHIFNTISYSYIKLTNVASVFGIFLNNAQNFKIFENTFEDCLLAGVRAVLSSNNSIFHNNFINTEPSDDGVSNYYENFYDAHTVDTNNDGLCDTPFSFIGGPDYSPVSKRNGWEQVSLGATVLVGTVSNIFSLVNGILTLTETGGTLTTDGTEQNVYINETPAGVFDPKIIQIDFTNQTATETVIIRESYRIKSGGGYIEKDGVTFAGVQSPKLKNVALEPNRFGTKVTIEKTGGTNRDYDWEAIYKI